MGLESMKICGEKQLLRVIHLEYKRDDIKKIFPKKSNEEIENILYDIKRNFKTIISDHLKNQ